MKSSISCSRRILIRLLESDDELIRFVRLIYVLLGPDPSCYISHDLA